MVFFKIFSSFKFIALIAFAFIVWQFFLFLSPAPRELNPYENLVCEKFSNGLVAGLLSDENVMSMEKPIEVGVMHLLNDKSGEITDVLSEAFSSNTNFVVSAESVPYKFVKELGKNLAKSSSVEEILSAGRHIDIDLLVGGKIESCEGFDGAATLDVNIYAFSPKNGKMIKYERIVERFDAEKDISKETTKMGKKARLLLMIFAVIIILLLPWLTEPVIWRVIDKKSNGLGFFLLLGYIAVDMVIVIAMCGIRFGSSNWQAVLIAIYVLLFGGYNYFVVEKIAKNY